MGNNISKEELQTRREFFKKAAKGILPMLGVFVAGPTMMMSTLTSCGCDGCEAACQDDCISTCSGKCNTSCYGSCIETASGSICSDCSSSCAGSSTSNTCSSCANDCSTSCKDTCQTTCSKTCSTTCEGSATGKPTTGSIDGHEYVDLGLSVLWATCNIGATSSNEKGTELPFVYPEYYEENNERSWFVKFRSLNIQPDTSICGTYLDIAKKKWGDKWRMPSKDEIQELGGSCQKEIIPNIGLKLTSKINGNSIILPYTGINTNNENFLAYWTGDTVIYKFSWSNEEYKGAYILKDRTFKDGPSIVVDKTYIAYSTDGSYYTGVYHVVKCNIRPISEKDNGNVSTCNGTCTANCSSDCSSTCKNECSGTCKGSCGNDCTGGCKEGCSTGCKTTCKGECSTTCTGTCTGSCSGGCSGSCSSGCSGGCKGTCSGSCGSGCSGSCSSCTATCADSCKAQTSQGCSNCATQCSGDCNHECTYGCGRQCYTSCGGNCKGKCGGNCYVECTSYSKNTPCSSCGGTCRSSCNENCTYDCYSTCQSIGYK